MAKVTITIEDTSGGKVSIKCNPTFEEIYKMESEGKKLTAAHGYAFKALNEIAIESRSSKPTEIYIPPKATM